MSAARLRYRPELDGLRGLAVGAVLLFHAQVPGFDGGYLGVSLFFTLSGFLITGLLLAEEGDTGRVDLAGFYSRRARRLLPASLLCLALIAVLDRATDWFTGVADLRRDLVGAALQVSNWVFLAGDGSYQELFADAAGTASPVEHFWSLSIEEQFYWIWPLVFVVAARRVPDQRGRLRLVVAATIVTAVSAPLIAAIWGGDAAYWSTPSRAAEILVGALVAVLVRRRTANEPSDGAWRWMAPVALVTLALAVTLFSSSGGPAFSGALPLVGLVSAVLLLGLEWGRGGLNRLLSVRPLVALGRISYGVYLFHWPIFVVLDGSRAGLDGPLLVAARLGASLLVAVLSYLVVERPIRTRPAGRTRPIAVVSLSATAAVVIAVIALVPASQGDYWRSPEVDEAASSAQIEPLGDDRLAPLVASTSSVPLTSSPTTGSTEVPPPSVATTTTRPALPRLERPVRTVVVGDSTAEALGAGLAIWASERPDLAQVSLLASVGCGFLGGGEIRLDDWRPVAPACREWFGARLLEEVSELRPDVAVMHTTSWDVLDRRWEDGVPRDPFDPAFVARLEADVTAITDQLLSAGVSTVVWVRQPVPNVYWMSAGQAQEDPARHQVLYDVMDRLSAARPSTVAVVDLPAWLDGRGLLVDRAARPDGVHWAPVAATTIARDFLGEEIVRLATGSA